MIELIGLGVLSHTLTWAKPFRMMLSHLNLDEYDEHSTPLEKFFQELFSCEMCLGFWVGILFTGSVSESSVVMAISRLWRAVVESLPTRI